jgi:hypothetical protein
MRACLLGLVSVCLTVIVGNEGGGKEEKKTIRSSTRSFYKLGGFGPLGGHTVAAGLRLTHTGKQQNPTGPRSPPQTTGHGGT